MGFPGRPVHLDYDFPFNPRDFLQLGNFFLTSSNFCALILHRTINPGFPMKKYVLDSPITSFASNDLSFLMEQRKKHILLAPARKAKIKIRKWNEQKDKGLFVGPEPEKMKINLKRRGISRFLISMCNKCGGVSEKSRFPFYECQCKEWLEIRLNFSEAKKNQTKFLCRELLHREKGTSSYRAIFEVHKKLKAYR